MSVRGVVQSPVRGCVQSSVQGDVAPPEPLEMMQASTPDTTIDVARPGLLSRVVSTLTSWLPWRRAG